MKRVFAIVLTALAVMGLRAAQVSLLTAYPGEEVFQLEGHTALRVVDDEGRDYVVNWGVFDFNTPNFVGRFVAGQTDYLCWPFPTRYFMEEYRTEGRKVVEQVLDLDSIQTARLLAAVGENLRLDNRLYRYNYVLDNCATRPLAIIEEAVGHQLLSDSLTELTFRSEMQRFHRYYPWYQFGIDLALGRNLDRPITERQAAFAPVTLMQQIAQTDILKETRTYGEQTLRSEPTPWPLTPMAAAIVVLILSVFATFTSRFARWFDTALFSLQFLGGCIITFLVFVSTHEATSPNLLLLWLNPLCISGVMLPWIKSAKKVGFWYFFANFALLILLIILAPALGRQMNPAFWPLIAADALRSIDRVIKCRNAITRS
ncbi:MAG: DUF4105 domain-containing protein [Bacteroides sp.]|nr:DUF4105 domain-containing protein [Bacteroides sp.]MCM1378603.1 DUF4105 domain-containing protein [Bacteroides sp.]MCM1444904.1 DUF4105 domain-containing protein [Prevotella sp.]